MVTAFNPNEKDGMRVEKEGIPIFGFGFGYDSEMDQWILIIPFLIFTFERRKKNDK